MSSLYSLFLVPEGPVVKRWLSGDSLDAVSGVFVEVLVDWRRDGPRLGVEKSVNGASPSCSLAPEGL
jgi:hypothetical protein